MRVASYNVWKGAHDDAAYSLLVDFISHQGLDVVCLQEADGWQDNNYARVRDFMGRTGMEHVLFGDSNTSSKLVTLSKHPIDMERSRVYKEGFFHCAIQTFIEVDGHTVEIWNNHFNPYNENQRLPEARFVAKRAKKAISLGDYNSLSRVDGYDDEFVRQQREKGNVRWLNGEKILYKTTDCFKKEGYVDAAVLRHAITNTFPARLDTEDRPPTARFDYVFVHEEHKKAIGSVQVIKNRWTRMISDHFPVIVTLNPELLAQNDVATPAARRLDYELAA